MSENPRRHEVRDAVRAFYDDQPFNFHDSVEDAALSIERNPVAAAYPDLDELLGSLDEPDVLELGCGAGWLSNTLAHQYGARVTSFDLSRAAIGRARAVAVRLGVAQRVTFHNADLFEADLGPPRQLVVSIGVLHHTGDAEGGVRRAARKVAAGGHLYIGLYHAPGRQPFLAAMRAILERDGEDAALRAYSELDGARRGDPTLLRSWFRDQVIHPHETQHTLREVLPWIEGEGLHLVSTSINLFGPTDDRESLFEQEERYAERSRHALEVERRYFPGFFTICAARPRG